MWKLNSFQVCWKCRNWGQQWVDTNPHPPGSTRLLESELFDWSMQLIELNLFSYLACKWSQKWNFVRVTLVLLSSSQQDLADLLKVWWLWCIGTTLKPVHCQDSPDCVPASQNIYKTSVQKSNSDYIKEIHSVLKIILIWFQMLEHHDHNGKLIENNSGCII